MTRISVVIPTRDGGAPLRACLTALARSFPPDGETLVVSDGGPADLKTQLRDFQGPLGLRCIRVEPGGPAAARNRGLLESRGEIVAFTDDDCRPREGWVSAIARGVGTSPPRATGGITLNGLRANRYADAEQVILDLLAAHERTSRGREHFFPSNNCAFPAAALRQIGGFNEAFRTAEDRELCRRWRAAGYDIERTPDAILDHDPGDDLPRFCRKYFSYGRGAARFHATGTRRSLRDSARFHLHVPRLLGPEIRRRGPVGGASLVGLLAVWEAANLAGFIAETANLARRNGSPDRRAPGRST